MLSFVLNVLQGMLYMVVNNCTGFYSTTTLQYATLICLSVSLSVTLWNANKKSEIATNIE